MWKAIQSIYHWRCLILLLLLFICQKLSPLIETNKRQIRGYNILFHLMLSLYFLRFGFFFLLIIFIFESLSSCFLFSFFIFITSSSNEWDNQANYIFMYCNMENSVCLIWLCVGFKCFFLSSFSLLQNTIRPKLFKSIEKQYRSHTQYVQDNMNGAIITNRNHDKAYSLRK